MTRLSLDAVYDLSSAALEGSGAIPAQAGPVAESVREAEAEGIRNVGLGYLPIYCEHLRCGKVKGDARPHLTETAPAVLRVDAGFGFCHPAFLRALPRFVEMAETTGIAALSITRSYSAGVVGWFVEHLASRGVVALAFANASASIAPWGGRKANPPPIPRRSLPAVASAPSAAPRAMVSLLWSTSSPAR